MLRHSRPGSIEKCSNTENDCNKEEHLKDQKKYERKRNFFKDYLIVYTSNSNLHGLKYIGETQRTYVERVFWLFVFTCGIVLCALLIGRTYMKWDSTPVIVTFAERTTPTWQIPYPAITMCLESKSRATVFNFTENYYLYNNSKTRAEMAEEDRNMLEDLTLVCDDHLAFPSGRQYSDGAQTVANLQNVTTNATSTFFVCKFKDKTTEHCETLNSRIFTEEGVCFSFNILRSEDLFRTENLHSDYSYIDHDNKAEAWTLEDGYSQDAPLESYPYRGAGHTAKAGIVFLMQTEVKDLDYLCKDSVQGFKILVHNPAEFPRLNDIYFRTSLKQEILIAVTPKMMATAEGLREFDAERRQCFFSDERYLNYFKVYTQSNCELECLTNFTYARCGCVHVGMPHNSTMKVCNTAKVKCMKDARMEFSVVGVKKVLDQNVVEENIDAAAAEAASCNCLPGCSSLTYEAETSQAEYEFKELCKAYRVGLDDDVDEKFFQSLTGDNAFNIKSSLLMSRLLVFFKAPQFIQYRRQELYGPTDFLAACGGLLGLFMGFSLLSLAEIVYFITLRLCCVVYQRPKSIQTMAALPNSEVQDTTESKEID